MYLPKGWEKCLTFTDQQPKAVKTVMEQAELMCQDDVTDNVFNYEEYKDRESLPKVAEDEEEKEERNEK